MIAILAFLVGFGIGAMCILGVNNKVPYIAQKKKKPKEIIIDMWYNDWMRERGT